MLLSYFYSISIAKISASFNVFRYKAKGKFFLDLYFTFQEKHGIFIITKQGKEECDMSSISGAAGNSYQNTISHIASGTKLQHAADGASELAIAEKENAQIKVLDTKRF